jgi:3-methyladenine DNA glycosylase AlkC
MSRIVNIAMGLVAYVCVATVIAAALAIGFLWHTDHLNSEKAFRIVALLHDVDLQQIAEAQRTHGDDVPPEEPALGDLLQRQLVQDRNLEVKMLALQRGRQEYDHRLQQLKEQTERYDRLAQDLQTRLKQHEELSTRQNVATVVGQLEQLRPDVAKESLMRWIKEGRMDDAILLMSRMSETKLSKILKTFETDEELDKLHQIHQKIIGGSTTTQLEKTLGEIKQLDGRS